MSRVLVYQDAIFLLDRFRTKCDPMEIATLIDVSAKKCASILMNGNCKITESDINKLTACLDKYDKIHEGRL